MNETKPISTAFQQGNTIMTSTLFWRLIWKEYRVQRSLWLALLVAVALLQWMVISMSHIRDAGVWFGLVAIGGFLGWFYALGAGAISFAADREDGTQIRLVTMACPAGLSVLAKLLFGCVTTFLFFGCALVMATWLAPPHANEEMARQIETQAGAIATIVFFSEMLALLMGMLSSLVVQRVLVALLLGGAACAIVESFLFAIALGENPASPEHGLWMFSAAIGLTSILLLFAICWLARGWMNRDFVAGPTVRQRRWWPRLRFVQVRDDGTLIIPLDSDIEERCAVPTVAQALVTRMPSRLRWWSMWLYGSRRQREWRFLVWRELVESRWLFCCGLLVLWLLSLINWGSFHRNTSMAVWTRSPWVAISLFAAGACGFMTFRQEQSGQQFLWLTQRGVSPVTVWLSKQIAWGWRLAQSLIVLNALPVIADVRLWLRHVFGAGENWGVASHWNPAVGQFQVGPNADDLLSVPSLLLAYFAVGQAASLLVKRTVVSFFVACIGGAVLTGWVSVLVRFEVPVVLTALPLSIALVMATFSHCRPWMMERVTISSSARVAVSVLMGLALACGLTWFHRVHEIPEVANAAGAPNASVLPEPALFGSWCEPHQQLAKSHDEMAAMLQPLTEIEQQTAEAYRQAYAQIARRPADEPREALRVAAQPVTDEQQIRQELRDRQPIIAELTKATAQRQCAFGTPQTLYWESSTAQRLRSEIHTLIRFLRDTAAKDLRVDDPQAALDKHLLALAVCVDVSRRANVRLDGRDTVHLILSDLRQWVAHPQVTTQMVDQAIAGVTDVLQRMPTPEAFRVAEAAYTQSILDGDFGDWLIDRHAALQNIPMPPAEQFVLHSISRLPGETERLRRLVRWRQEHIRQLNADFAASCRAATFTAAESRWTQTTLALKYHDLRHWVQSTPIARVLPAANFEELQQLHLSLATEARTTILMLALVDEHRGQPAPLTLDVRRSLPVSVLDPATGKSFDWWPHGLPIKCERSGLTTPGFELPPERPFLVSGFSFDRPLVLRRIRYVAEPLPMPGMPAGGGFAPGSSGTPPLPESINPPPENPPTTEELLSSQFVLEARPSLSTLMQGGHGFGQVFAFPPDVFAPRDALTLPAWLPRIVPEPEFRARDLQNHIDEQ